MGYTEGEIINGLKDKNAVISTVYNWLVESKVVSKGSVSIGSISSDTVTSNDNSYSNRSTLSAKLNMYRHVITNSSSKEKKNTVKSVHKADSIN